MLKVLNEGDAQKKDRRKKNLKDRFKDYSVSGTSSEQHRFDFPNYLKLAANAFVDSGVTPPLRARKNGEKLHHLPGTKVIWSRGKGIYMSLAPSGVIIGGEGLSL